MPTKTNTNTIQTTQTLTPAQKAWQTRRENARKAELSARAHKAWETRRARQAVGALSGLKMF